MDPEESTLDASEFLDECIQQWTASLNRGGLLHCSPEFFHFIKVVEVFVSVHLNTETIEQFASKKVICIIVGKLKAMSVQSAFWTLVGHNLTTEQLCEGLY